MLRIGADRAGDDELADLVNPALLEHVRAHDEVRVPVPAGIRAVRADAADLGGEMEDELGTGVVEEPGRGLHRGQVVVPAPGCEDVVAVAFEPFHEVRAEEAAATGDEYPCHPASVVRQARSPVL